MIEKIDGMPPGTVGLKGSGKLTREDYRDVLEPVLRDAVASGEVRMLFVLTDWDGLDPSAIPEDIKTGLTLGIGRRSAWKRLALVTDTAWVRKSMDMFAPLIPGESMSCEPDRLEEARAWVAG